MYRRTGMGQVPRSPGAPPCENYTRFDIWSCNAAHWLPGCDDLLKCFNLYTPEVQAALRAGGVPEGYNADTGTVSEENVTGETTSPGNLSLAVGQAMRTIPGGPSDGTDDRPWYCKYLGIGCDGIPGWAIGALVVVGGVLTLNVVGGRR